MQIDYKDRILGQIYYCLHIESEYIFQCTKKLNMAPYIIKYSSEDWENIDTGADFGSDWREKNDEEMRLATPEEIGLFLEKAKEWGKLLPIPSSHYEIY